MEQAAAKGWTHDADRANTVINFMEQLEHTKGKWAGKKFKLDPLQKFIVWNLFGWKNADGLRRFRVFYVTVARKWGKSTFVAALAIVLLFFDQPTEAEAEGYVAATKEEQAKRVVDQAWKMVQRIPTLKSKCREFRYRGQIFSFILEPEPYNGSWIKSLGSDSKTADALNPHFVIRDEKHAWGEHLRKFDEKLSTGSGSRDQPLDGTITTGGDDLATLWLEQDGYACKVLESSISGECIDDTLFAIIARLDEQRPCPCGGGTADCDACNGTGDIPGDDPFDESVWEKANPGLPHDCPSLEFLRSQANRAKHDLSFRSAWIQFHCNSKTRSVKKVIDPQVWAKCEGTLSRWDGNCFGAFDLGWVNDLASVALCYFNGDKYEFRHVSFCPEDGPHDLTRPPWVTWVKNGLLIPTEGTGTDFAKIEELIIQWHSEYHVTDWSYDAANAHQMASRLYNDQGIHVVEFPQNARQYNEPIRELLRCLVRGDILHNGDQLLAFAAGNLTVRENSRGEWIPGKKTAKEKIDPMVAAIKAFGRHIKREPENPGTYYETNPLEVV